MDFFDKYPGLMDKIEDAGYTISHCNGNIYEFGKFSSYGRDFSFCINTADDIEEFRANIITEYDNFDPDYETYIWLDETGHGKNGAPYSIRDTLDDSLECERFIEDLAMVVGDYILNKVKEG